jgi:hypothetical protein
MSAPAKWQVALALAEWKCANILKRGVGLAMARYNTARAALRHAINGTTPQKRECADFETTVAGIPCGVVITIYSGVRQWRQHTFSGAGPGDCDPPEYEDVEWWLVDSKGYPAGWLEEKMNDNDVTRITCECMEFKRSDGDEY